jgi:hypothetical protein
MPLYNSFEKLTPKTSSMRFFPTEIERYPIVTLIVDVKRARGETREVVFARRAGRGNVNMFVTNLGEIAVKSALALINNCPISEVIVQFHDQTDASKLN